jgi:glycosyltransferase involved in cell wall biosynthesis
MRFLFLARPAAHKGLPDLMRAFALLPARGWNLTVVGGVHATEREEVEHLAAHLTAVDMLPPWPNASVPTLMRSSDVVIVPSRYENFCNVALEAIASGRAVIGSRCGGIPDLVIDRWNGLLFPPGDDAALAACVTKLLDSPILVRTFGRRGRSAALRFDWAVVAAETVRLLESLPPSNTHAT